MANGCRFRIHCDTLGTEEQIGPGQVIKNIIDVGYIGDITETYSATLTKTSIMTLPSKKAMVIDSGVEKTFSFGYTRVCKGVVDEQSLDATKWSNGHWIMWLLSKVVDRWQGATDGQYISLTMDSDMDELYPSFTKTRCYIKQFSYTYSSGSPMVISGDIKFVLGSFKLSKTTENSVIFDSNFSDSGLPTNDLEDMTICMVSQTDTYPALEYPGIWYEYAKSKIPDKTIIWWCIDKTTKFSERTTETGWLPGQNIPLSDDTITVYARYSRT